MHECSRIGDGGEGSRLITNALYFFLSPIHLQFTSTFHYFPCQIKNMMSREADINLDGISEDLRSHKHQVGTKNLSKVGNHKDSSATLLGLGYAHISLKNRDSNPGNTLAPNCRCIPL